ncbi:hypothetical protein M3P21_20420 [Ruegeria sp. 2012CJ41-6]|uniref:Uncharacterized protein n=1 Tax=Ruegeria spongiae TaxID=2942209 RepID=A0ABT0Q7P8_9RHOB|nr:hypothetical protein [Ruegeria spongiae]MCL6285886.1 hypothetical protein [Ruegeria spongiae]
MADSHASRLQLRQQRTARIVHVVPTVGVRVCLLALQSRRIAAVAKNLDHQIIARSGDLRVMFPICGGSCGIERAVFHSKG